ncbi:MAG: aminopeptidase P family protein [Candidatus Aminicenantes bacterium]|nr:MAG: aminopeptidase P family protein [Candidatus Aminicenantes bacterium]
MKKKSFLCILLLSLSLLLGGEEIPLFTSDFSPEEFKQRRDALYDQIGKEAIAIIQSAPMPDSYVKFRQSNQFYYLCGVETWNSTLLLDGSQRRSIIFLPPKRSVEGHMFAAEDQRHIIGMTGVNATMPVDEMGEYLARLSYRSSIKSIYTPFFSFEGLAMSRDLASIGDANKSANPWDNRPPRAANFVNLLRLRYPQFEVKNLSPILDVMRLIKSPAELNLIRRATVLSGQAIMECMRSMEPGVFEYEIAALAKFVFLRNGAQGDAYHAIAASGPNMIHSHYNANFRKVEDGDFFILDYAPDYRYYMSDLTRTWPVNGKFNGWQRELYGFYVRCYQAILKAIRPHETASVIIKEAVAEMKQALAETEFSKEIYEKAAKSFVARFTRASSYAGSRLGHWVGLSTHDVGRDSGPLRPGMVFTIEPALRVPEENIYIRCEDLIIIHDDHAEIASDFLPLAIDDVEKLMKEEGLLQEYPRIK